MVFAQFAHPTARTAATLSLLLGVQASYTPKILNDTQSLTGFPPCDALIAANLSHIVHMPSSPLYPTLVKGSWTLDTQRAPFCFAQPSNTDEVSRILLALQSTSEGAGDWHVAVRSGGHASDYASNIDNGVTIDLTNLNTSTYNAATNIASVGTGARWGRVYADLAKQGVSVTGGREGVVGVGGLVLGGGVSWYSARTGFACDSVVNYEVVLADGRIINANATDHSDLWRALKGGGSNFGIVTKFDMEAFPASNLYIERSVISSQHSDAVVDAVAGFTDLDQSYDDNAMITILTYSPKDGNISIALTNVNTVNNANTTAFDAFKPIPKLQPPTKNSVSLAQAANSTQLAANTRNVGAGALVFANDPRIMRFCIEQHANLVADLKKTLGPQNFSTILDFQSLPYYMTEIGVQRGGNMLGLERSRRNKLFFVSGVTLLSPDTSTQDQQFPPVYQKVSAMKQRIIAFAKSIGGSEDFIYLNYADSTQDVIGSYGPANAKHIKRTASKYDPYGFFQRMVSGGFKASRTY